MEVNKYAVIFQTLKKRVGSDCARLVAYEVFNSKATYCKPIILRPFSKSFKKFVFRCWFESQDVYTESPDKFIIEQGEKLGYISTEYDNKYRSQLYHNFRENGFSSSSCTRSYQICQHCIDFEAYICELEGNKYLRDCTQIEKIDF
jgi:hypothetical protein